MISWIDITSRRLVRFHERWIALRGARLMPSVKAFNEFAGAIPAESIALVRVLPAPASPVFLPASPVFLPASPVFLPASPVFLPASPVFLPASPVFLPASPVFLKIGADLSEMLPNCFEGTSFSEIGSTAHRAVTTAPFHRVIKSRQPDCRRGKVMLENGSVGYEQLLLPFDNGQMKVCLVQAIYD